MADELDHNDDQQSTESSSGAPESPKDAAPDTPTASEPQGAAPDAEPAAQQPAPEDEASSPGASDSAPNAETPTASSPDHTPAATAPESNALDPGELEAALQAAGGESAGEQPEAASSSAQNTIDPDELAQALQDVQAEDAADATVASAETLATAAEGETSAADVEAAMQAMLESADSDEPGDDVETQMQAALDSVEKQSSAPRPSAATVPDTEPFVPPDLEATKAPAALGDICLLDDVDLDVKIELGRANMYIEDVLQLGVGSVVELDKLAGDPVDIYVNERLVARGEVLVLNENFCVRINNILSPIPELESE